jgi:hypothetical protein
MSIFVALNMVQVTEEERKKQIINNARMTTIDYPLWMQLSI